MGYTCQQTNATLIPSTGTSSQTILCQGQQNSKLYIETSGQNAISPTKAGAWTGAGQYSPLQ